MKLFQALFTSKKGLDGILIFLINNLVEVVLSNAPFYYLLGILERRVSLRVKSGPNAVVHGTFMQRQYFVQIGLFCVLW